MEASNVVELRPAPIVPDVDAPRSPLALRSTALDALMALGLDYSTAARHLAAAIRDGQLTAMHRSAA